MTDTIHCRRARPDDANAIAIAYVDSWQNAFAGHIPDDYLANLSVPDSQKDWDERLAKIDPNLFVGELGGEVTGVCGVGPSADSGAGPQIGTIELIYLHTRCWRSGLGRRLLAFSSDVLREHGYSEATLWVLDGNARARAFYEACGWELDRRASGRKTVTHIANVELPHLRYRFEL